MAMAKWGGRDCELSTTGVDSNGRTIECWKVTRDILACLRRALIEHRVHVWARGAGRTHGIGSAGYASAYSTDCLRHWTSGGQCYYSDMGHVEVCTAVTKSPRHFAAQCVSTLLAAEAARRLAENEAEAGSRFALTTANADALDPAISFGSHLSLSIEKWLWKELFHEHRHPAILGYVTSALAAAIAFFGAGYIMPLNDGSVVYSLSARAHHLTRMKTLSTTEAFGRGLLNSRHEPHGEDQERLHLIGFDFCVLSAALLFSLLQCVLAAAEECYCGLILFDPIRSLRTWSWKADLQRGRLPAAAMLVDGRRLTLPAYIRELAGVLLEMCQQGLITDDVAPQATEMLPLVIDLANYAEEGSLQHCSRHLSWASKLLWLTQLCEQNDLDLASAEIRMADHDFGHTDPDQGALWRLWEEGLVDPLIDLDDARQCLAEGPPESRDWGRGRLIGKFFDHVSEVDWRQVDLTLGEDRWSPRLRVDLPHLDSLNRARSADLIDTATDPAHFGQLLNAQGNGRIQQTDPVDAIDRHLASARQGLPETDPTDA